MSVRASNLICNPSGVILSEWVRKFAVHFWIHASVLASFLCPFMGYFVYLLADIIGPATLLQDNLAELYVPIRSGSTPRTKHPDTIRNHLNAVFAHPQTLADIGISKQAHPTHLAALHTV